MKEVLIVGLGGGIGAIARYLTGLWILSFAASWRFPLSIFTVNIVGSFVIGLIAALSQKYPVVLNKEALLFLMTGVLGGFTTFSSFSYDTVLLVKDGELAMAFIYPVLSVVLGFLAALVAMRLVVILH